MVLVVSFGARWQEVKALQDAILQPPHHAVCIVDEGLGLASWLSFGWWFSAHW